MADSILTFNAGSSSIKLALFTSDGRPMLAARGQVEGIGGPGRVTLRDRAGAMLADGTQPIPDHAAALAALLDALARHGPNARVVAVGHRVVHGGVAFTAPVVADADVLAGLRKLAPLAPLHQPHNVAGIEAARRTFPEALQVACFDTAFHRDQPWVNDTFALPRAFYERGVRRYGFHGLAYESIVDRLRAEAPAALAGRVVAAHLGNGASMCAMTGGRAVASTMGFSPLDGLVMGTRCGQIDPGVLLYLMAEDRMDAADLADLLYKRSGLLGLSGLSNDVRVLEAAEEPEAAAALDAFVARAVRELGGLVALLGGLDALVFSGGIGENAWRLRARICAGLGFMGLGLDGSANEANRPVLSAADSSIQVRIVPADEETVIARHAARLLRR